MGGDTVTGVATADLRAGCRGIVPLDARLEPWQVAICEERRRLTEVIDAYGSPVNLLNPDPLRRNAAELEREARARNVVMRVFFARKANKALCFVRRAADLGLGVDVAGERELRQVLDIGIHPRDVILTAAVKPEAVVELAVRRGVTIALDNADETRLVRHVAERQGTRAPVAVRVAPQIPGRPRSRFGLEVAEADGIVGDPDRGALTVHGVHFHLDGYRVADRIDALGPALELVDRLRSAGHPVAFVDIGGGIPMSYLDDGSQWERFWEAHRDGLRGRRAPLTFGAEGLGLMSIDDAIVGEPRVYPYFQRPVRGAWLAQLLDASIDGGRTVAAALRERGLELRCEPGRSLLDGCGMTAARVEFRKRHGDDWLVGLAMNRTQCRSTSDDFLVDPLLAGGGAAEGAMEGYLVGAYCIERELLTWRRLRFPRGVAVGDVVVFPNTAGYLMHILESTSHQMPLAANLVVSGRDVEPDGIDQLGP